MGVHYLVKVEQIWDEVQAFFSSRTHASSRKPTDSQGFVHTTPKSLATSRGADADLLSAVSSALLNRAANRGAVLCPGEQRGTWPQLALGTGCLQIHRSGRNQKEAGEP